MSSVASSPPEQGQLVSVRSRNWMVTDVSASTLPPERLQTGLKPPQHLITLSSVEDDGLGEELQVSENVSLPEPTGFDPPDKLDAFLDAVRWGAASTADVKNIQAPFRSGIDADSLRLFAFEEPPPVLQAVKVIPNEAAHEEMFVIPTNMRVPAASVIHRLFVDETASEGACKKDLDCWESQGKKQPGRAVAVEARKVADRVIAIVQEVEPAPQKSQRPKVNLLFEE